MILNYMAKQSELATYEQIHTLKTFTLHCLCKETKACGLWAVSNGKDLVGVGYFIPLDHSSMFCLEQSRHCTKRS